MTELVIELSPATLGSRGQRYDAVLDGRVLCTSRQPLFDATRVLLGEGMSPETVIEARHAGSSMIAMRSTVGEAARWAIEERDAGGIRRVPWRPYDGPTSELAVRSDKADCRYAGRAENGPDGSDRVWGPEKVLRAKNGRSAPRQSSAPPSATAAGADHALDPIELVHGFGQQRRNDKWAARAEARRRNGEAEKAG